MYPEFIAIYVMLAIILIALGFVIFFLIKIMKDGAGSSSVSYSQNTQPVINQQYNVDPAQYQQAGQYSSQMSVIYCRQCATQYDASNAYCPNCGARR